MIEQTPLIAELDRLEAQATPGPWEKDYGHTIGHIKSVASITRPEDKGCVGTPTVLRYDEGHAASSVPPEQREANAELVTALRNAYPALRASVLRARELEKALAGAEARWRSAADRNEVVTKQAEAAEKSLAQAREALKMARPYVELFSSVQEIAGAHPVFALAAIDAARAQPLGEPGTVKTAAVWIPVDDDIPEDDSRSRLIWCADNQCTFTAYRERGKWRYFGGMNFPVDHKVTHWQPVPEPPGCESEGARSSSNARAQTQQGKP